MCAAVCRVSFRAFIVGLSMHEVIQDKTGIHGVMCAVVCRVSFRAFVIGLLLCGVIQDSDLVSPG